MVIGPWVLRLENIVLENDEYKWEYLPGGQIPSATSAPLRTADSRLVMPDGNVQLNFDGEIKVWEISPDEPLMPYRCQAPEAIVWSGDNPVGDIWSTGCILLELFTCGMVFKAVDNCENLVMAERIWGEKIGSSQARWVEKFVGDPL